MLVTSLMSQVEGKSSVIDQLEALVHTLEQQPVAPAPTAQAQAQPTEQDRELVAMLEGIVATFERETGALNGTLDALQAEVQALRRDASKRHHYDDEVQRWVAKLEEKTAGLEGKEHMMAKPDTARNRMAAGPWKPSSLCLKFLIEGSSTGIRIDFMSIYI